MTRAELAALIDGSLVIARIAAKPHRCACADESQGYTISITFRRRGSSLRLWRAGKREAEQAGRDERAKYPTAKVAVEPRPNRNYRPDPDCLGDIKPGDVYGEYVGDAPAYTSGTPYCRHCAVTVWGTQS